MRECHCCTIFKMYMNSFGRQRARLKILMKVVLKADRETSRAALGKNGKSTIIVMLNTTGFCKKMKSKG